MKQKDGMAAESRKTKREEPTLIPRPCVGRTPLGPQRPVQTPDASPAPRIRPPAANVLPRRLRTGIALLLGIVRVLGRGGSAGPGRAPGPRGRRGGVGDVHPLLPRGGGGRGCCHVVVVLCRHFFDAMMMMMMILLDISLAPLLPARRSTPLLSSLPPLESVFPTMERGIA